MKRLICIQILLAMLVGFASCQRDEELMPEQTVERTDNLPIQLEVSIGSAVTTRSVEQAKKFFSAGNPETGEKADIIHVESTFYLEENGEQSIQKRYCALEFTEEGKWVQKGGSNFAWPNTAVRGDFKAYYVHGSTGELTANEGSGTTTTTQTLFTELVDGRDPMRADTVNFRYGHTVGLRFEHILTHLTIIELDAGIDDKLSIEAKPEKLEPSDAGMQGGNIVNADFNNAFKISLVSGSTGPEIKFEYLSVEDENGDKVTIQAPTELVRDKQTRQESCQVGFFLEPDCVYNKFNIYYSNGVQYLEYENSDPNSKDVLKGNNRYTFNVKKSAGVTIMQKPEQKWDESDEFTEIVDAEGFLTAITKNEGYTEEGVVILEPTTNPIGTRLVRNVKFKDPYYHVFPHKEDVEAGIPAYDFVPNVGDDNVFDGGYHYIKELCCPLFFENHGTIKNLGFLDMNIGGGKYGPWRSMEAYNEDAVKTYDYSSTGAVATQNLGRMQNIRIKNLTVNVGVVSGTGGGDASLEVHNVGALFGINNGSGYVEQVYLSGKIDITVQNIESTPPPRVYIGGLTGQNLGSLIDISQLVDNNPELTAEQKPKPASILITNKLFGGTGDYEIGGFVGNNTGKLSEVSIPTTPTPANGNAMAVTIDCSESFGVISYLGGVAGIADSSLGNEISSCLIGSGMVRAGVTGKTAYADAYSFTGGLVGVYHERTHIYNCTTFCSVIGARAGGNDVTLATGGIFGEIKKIQATESGQLDPEGTMGPLAAFGSQLEGDNAGCFAGMVHDENKTWENTYKERADVKTFGNIPYIGSVTR